MKVALITSGFPKDENDFGGAAFLLTHSRKLSKHIEITVFTLYYPTNIPEYNFYNTKVFSFTRKPPAPSNAEKYLIWKNCQKKFEQEHKLKQFDVIHSMWAGEPGYNASKLSAEFNIPLIANICGGELAELKEINYGSRLKFWQKRFVDTTLKQASKIISGSDYITDKVKQYYSNQIQDKVVKIPFGIDEKLFTPSNNIYNPDKPILINIASAVPVKSHITLFKAISIVKDTFQNVLLKVYGRDDKNELKKLVNKMKLQDNIYLYDFIDYTKIPDAISETDVFVLSSLYESQNLSLLEAAFCGLPLISTDVGIAKEITDNIVAAGDYKKLAEKINYVLLNYNSEKQKAIDMLSIIKNKFSVETSVKNFLNLYKSVKEK